MITKQKVNMREVFGVAKPSSPLSKPFRAVLFYGTATYIALLIVDVILSSFYGLSLTSNYISDLGSRKIIPFPYLHDLICVFGGIISLPINFFVRKKLHTVYKESKHSIKFAEFGVVLGVVGNIGYILLGVFSLDRAGPQDLYQGVVAFIAFSGYVLSIFFFSLNIVLSHKCRLKNLGLFGLVAPIILFVAYCTLIIPLIEWFLLSSILLFLLLLDYYVFKL